MVNNKKKHQSLGTILAQIYHGRLKTYPGIFCSRVPLSIHMHIYNATFWTFLPSTVGSISHTKNEIITSNLFITIPEQQKFEINI